MKIISVLSVLLTVSLNAFAGQSVIMETKSESQLNEIGPEFGSSHSSEILVQVVKAMLEKVIPKEKQERGVEIQRIGLSTFDYKSLTPNDRWLRVSASIKKCEVSENKSSNLVSSIKSIYQTAKAEGLSKAASAFSTDVSNYSEQSEQRAEQFKKCYEGLGRCWVRVHWYKTNLFWESQYNRVQSVSLYGAECSALKTNNVLEMTTTVQKISPTRFEIKGLE